MKHRGKARPMVMPYTAMPLLREGMPSIVLSELDLHLKCKFEVSVVGHLKSLDYIIDPLTIILLSIAPGS